MNTCNCIIRTGNRSGQVCGKKAKYLDPEPRCGIHKITVAALGEQQNGAENAYVNPVNTQENNNQDVRRPHDALIFFGPKGASLDDMLTSSFTAFDAEYVQPDVIGDMYLSKQNGYVNVRVGSPVFVHGETMYITLPSKVDVDFESDTPLTQAEVGKQVAEQIFKFYQNPGNYKLDERYCIHHMFLYSISYNEDAGVFEADIKTRYDL